MLRMTKKALQFSALCLGLVLFSSQAMAANFNNLSFMGNYVDAHPTTVNVFKPFIEQTAKDLNNKVTFNYFGTNVLFPESESYQVLNDGRVDFGVVRPSLFAGMMNLVTVVDIPGMAPNAIVGSLLAQDIMDKFPEVRAEFPENSVPFTIWTSAAYQIHTIDPIKNTAELAGKKIIAWDAITREILVKLGANPIRIASTDSYLSLSKGMADGVICPLAPVRSFKISDVAKHHLILDLAVGTFNMSVFKPLWDDFPADIQAYFKENGGKNFSLKVGQSLEDGAIRDTKWMEELGHSFYYMDAAEQEKVAGMLASAKQDWLDSIPAKDKEIAKKVLAYAEERAAYYRAEFAKGTYGDYSTK